MIGSTVDQIYSWVSGVSKYRILNTDLIATEDQSRALGPGSLLTKIFTLKQADRPNADEFWSCRRLLDEIEIGREIKKAEARAILLKAEQDGWVHLPPAQADDKIYIGIAPR